MFSIYDLFLEFDNNSICVTDFNIVVNGTRLDYIVLNDKEEIELWAGNPAEDKFAEQLIIEDKSTLEMVYEEILDNM